MILLCKSTCAPVAPLFKGLTLRNASPFRRPCWWLCGIDHFADCCNYKPVDSSRRPRKSNHLTWLAKSATDSKMLSSVVVRAFRLPVPD